jgi:hypothetical protein
MISRVWHGWTSRENADAYERLLLSTILPGIQARGIAAYRGAFLYRRDVRNADQESGADVEFVTTMLFESMDAVRQFAGDDYEVAVVPPAARRLLSRYDPRSTHYDVLLEPR